MTTITLEPNRLSVVGHAGYGKVGYDIVCSEEAEQYISNNFNYTKHCNTRIYRAITTKLQQKLVGLI